MNLKTLWQNLFPHDKPIRSILTVIVVFAAAAWASTCRANDAVRLETGVQFTQAQAPTLALHVEFNGPKDADIECGVQLVGKYRNDLGVMGVQCLLVDGIGRVDVGIGAVYTNRESQYLGSLLNFALLLRWNINDRWSINLRHWSSGGTTEENTGYDTALIGYRF